MSLIKEKIKYSSADMNLKITLGSDDGFTGYQQDIDRLTQFTTAELVNPASDVEVRRFKHFATTTTSMAFQFYNGSTYASLFTHAGFTSEEIQTQNRSMLNSFFILDFYDSYEVYNQTKIFTVYLTKIGKTPIYSLDATANNQFYRWFVPLSYINQYTGATTTGYVKLSFYNAKTGKLVLFANFDNYGLFTPQRLYFQTELDFLNKTWKITTPSYPAMKAKELPATLNALYTEKANDTVDNFENLSQNYPSGNTFNYIDGTYLTT